MKNTPEKAVWARIAHWATALVVIGSVVWLYAIMLDDYTLEVFKPLTLMYLSAVPFFALGRYIRKVETPDQSA